MEAGQQLTEIHIRSAKALAALKTKNGKPRLFTADKVNRFEKDRERKWLLAPSIPKDAVFKLELADTRQWIQRQRKRPGKKR